MLPRHSSFYFFLTGSRPPQSLQVDGGHAAPTATGTFSSENARFLPGLTPPVTYNAPWVARSAPDPGFSPSFFVRGTVLGRRTANIPRRAASIPLRLSRGILDGDFGVLYHLVEVPLPNSVIRRSFFRAGPIVDFFLGDARRRRNPSQGFRPSCKIRKWSFLPRPRVPSSARSE